MHGERMNVYTTSVGKREGKRQLGRPGRMWKDNIQMDVKVTECGWYRPDSSDSG
jgi:hypothetical protein